MILNEYTSIPIPNAILVVYCVIVYVIRIHSRVGGAPSVGITTIYIFSLTNCIEIEL